MVFLLLSLRAAKVYVDFRYRNPLLYMILKFRLWGWLHFVRPGVGLMNLGGTALEPIILATLEESLQRERRYFFAS